MSFVIGGITLPQFPHKIQEKNPSETKVRAMPKGDLASYPMPLIVSTGKLPRTLEIECYIYNSAYTPTQIASTYIVPFRNLVHTIVAVTGTPDALYDGSYILDSFDPVPIVPGVFKASFKLMMGGSTTMIVI